jgi:CRISPR-associated protein Cas1
LVREHAHNHPDADLSREISQLAELCRQVDSPQDLSSLLGLEGSAARVYFQAFAKMLRHGFRFSGRHRHPSPDPVNALLSLGYTMVYNEISSLLDGLGFDPYLGFYHQPDYGHATLASDLMEELRAPLTDRFTLSIINNRVFDEQDFFLHPASGGIFLKDEPRKRYFTEYERFVTRPMGLSGDGESASYRQLFRHQAEKLKEAILGAETYCPYRFCW